MQRGREVYVEFIPVGAYVKVSAVDAASGTEVSIVGPSNASPAELEANVMRKLDYVMQKKKTQTRPRGSIRV